ncbi:hypothetical protein BCR43DRAFT_529582 [Syncephalastrum racemosum]|uniref:DUF1014-domain-containing protein n=1 Tax=Syncephalastrum racemosum TaxID=13706 RepID=A0A1X2HMQ7_SYNRA|nr:hypothetical protein BCR43DRAFT_529582 [Syncephalastrum racemosum]
MTGNSKADAANAKKAAAKAEKDQAAAAKAAAAEAEQWNKGSKSNAKKEAEAEKKAAAAAKKAEKEKLMAEEEKEMGKISVTIKPQFFEYKTANKRAAKADAGAQARRTIPEFSATNIDDAIDLLSIDDKKDNKKEIDRHPERRFKAALAAFEEREMANFKKDNPGLRQSQLKELIYKAFQKSPENPFNQQSVAYNASKDDVMSVKAKKKKELEERLRSSLK